MFKTIALFVVLLIVVAVVVILILAALKPDQFQVRRATTIKGPPQRIFDLINDFHRWAGWSPWEKKDPGMKQSFSGAASGKGAACEWDGNKNVGKGRMEIAESTPPSRIVIDLHFIKPFEGRNTAEFAMQPGGAGQDATDVTWTMTGRSAFPAKVICVFMDMDKMIGKDFEAGLANLKALAEKGA
jgi:uncharacterized protein YndB with AHSA1/START domain